MPLYFIRSKDRAELKRLLDILKTRKTTFVSGDMTVAKYLSKWSDHLITRYDSDNNYTSGYTRRTWRLYVKTIPTMTFLQFKRKLAADSRPFVKSKPAFMMGFEIEGCVHPDYRDELINYLMDLYPASLEENLVHHDGSIRPKCRAIEIVTPPLYEDDAIERLEWLFGMLSIMSDEGLFETNGTCGFHVNFSERESFSHPFRPTRDKFAFEFMKRLDPNKWRRAFRRLGNKYCWWEGPPVDINDIERAAHSKRMAAKLGESFDKIQHWAAVNTSHLHANKATNRRLEVRVAGGANYHVKHERMSGFLVDIQEAAQQAYESI